MNTKTSHKHIQHTSTHTHTYTHIHTHTHTYTHIHTHAHTYTHIHTHTHTHFHALAYTLLHIHMLTQTLCTHTHTHTDRDFSHVHTPFSYKKIVNKCVKIKRGFPVLLHRCCSRFQQWACHRQTFSSFGPFICKDEKKVLLQISRVLKTKPFSESR